MIIRTLAVAAAFSFATGAAWGQLSSLRALEVGAGFSTPTYVTGAPGDNTHLYVLEHGANGSASIKVLDLTNGSSSTFLTITGVATGGGEQGLLGLAFDPNYTSNKLFYVNYVGTGGTNGITRVQSYQAINATVANSTAVATLLSFDQPQTNHNGGWLGFSNRAGDARNLYIAAGDGGGDDDNDAGHATGGNGQSTSTLLGKMLRITINPTGTAYSIPSTNPFASVGGSVRGEIFAYGLRNPFRASFDRATGNMYIGDVGQTAREELDIQLASNPNGGENYGWRLMEGTISTPSGGSGGSPPAGYDPPLLDYPRSGASIAGRTIIGGYVYNGTAIPDLVGTYIFGDYLGVSGGRTSIFALKYANGTYTNLTNLTTQINTGTTPLIGNISSFGEGTSGEIFMVDITNGKIFQLVAVPEPASLLMLGAGATFLLRRRRVGY